MVMIDQEPDTVPRRPLVRSAIIVAVGIAASAIAALVLGGWHGLGRVAFRPAPRIDQEAFASQPAAPPGAGYGWVDRDARIVRVPIEVAIDVYLSRGVPR
jgi:hypothetical protein